MVVPGVLSLTLTKQNWSQTLATLLDTDVLLPGRCNCVDEHGLSLERREDVCLVYFKKNHKIVLYTRGNVFCASKWHSYVIATHVLLLRFDLRSRGLRMIVHSTVL